MIFTHLISTLMLRHELKCRLIHLCGCLICQINKTWKDFVDKRIQEALNPTLLRSATFISNTTTSVSTSVSCTANTTMPTFSNVRRRFDKLMIMRMSRKTSPSFQFWLVTSPRVIMGIMKIQTRVQWLVLAQTKFL